jgi:hypothetical protein
MFQSHLAFIYYDYDALFLLEMVCAANFVSYVSRHMLHALLADVMSPRIVKKLPVLLFHMVPLFMYLNSLSTFGGYRDIF